MLLFYLNPGSIAAIRLQQIMAALPGLDPRYCRSLDDFKHLLKQSVGQAKVVVYLALDREDLSAIQSVQPLLYDAKLILIIPDRHQSTIEWGHKIGPRFLSYADSSFEDVRDVIKKICGYRQQEANASQTTP